MALRDQLSTKLDAGSLVTTLLGRTASLTTELDGITLPDAGDGGTEAGTLASQIDLSTITRSVTQVVGELTPLLEGLPSAGDTIQTLRETLEWVERLASGDLPNDFTELTRLLSEELGGASQGGFADILLRLSDLFGSSRLTQLLRDLVAALTRAAGVDMPADAFKPPEIAQAIVAAVRVLGGLTSLETILSEAERLTGVMASQLDPSQIEAQRQRVDAFLTTGPGSLAAFLAGTQPSNPAQLEAARSAITQFEAQLFQFRDQLAEGMGYGEATLVFLDFARAQTELAIASRLVHETDLGPLERTIASLGSRLAPLAQLDLTGAPARGFEEVVTLLEARVASVAAGIAAFDITRISTPLTSFIETATDLPSRLNGAISDVTTRIRGALETVRSVIERLPLDSIGSAVRQALDPVRQLLEFLTNLLGSLMEALQAALTAVRTTLGKAETAVDEFKAAVEALFRDAAAFVEGLNLEGVVGQVTDNVRQLADILAKAQLKPYFDTAADALGTATGVVENVPFSLIPDSMEQEVVDALRPIKTADVDAFQAEIEALLQLGPDGKFQLRPEIEASVKTVQDKYDELIAEIRRLDPRGAVAQLDAGLQSLIDRIRAISPQVELAPVQEALDRVRSTLGSFDLNAALRPLTEGFQRILTAIDAYSPAALIEPIESRIDEVREQVIDATHLRDLAAHLDTLETQARALINRLDPVQLEPEVSAALGEASGLLDRLPTMQPFGAFGDFVVAMLSGSGLRVHAPAFDEVLAWLTGRSGTAALVGRARRIADAVQSTKIAVQGIDPQALSSQWAIPYQVLKQSVQGWPAGAERAEVLARIERLDPSALLGPLLANRTRYLGLLDAASAATEVIRRTGFSEVDVTTGRLRTAATPFQAALAKIRECLALAGLADSGQGPRDILRRLFAVAGPARLTHLVMPLLTALRGRAIALLEAVLRPFKKGVQDLLAVLEAIDLTPLREAVDGVYQEVRAQVAALSPEQLLGDVLASFTALQQEVAAFNPLAAVQSALTEMRDTTSRVLGKLVPSDILATPLSIYDDIVGALGALNVSQLLTPVLDQLDTIAQQVDQGLDITVVAFHGLQDALPDQIGSTSLSASASVA